MQAIFPAISYCIDLIGGDYIVANEEVISAFRPVQKITIDIPDKMPIKAPHKEIAPLSTQTKEMTQKAGTLSHLDKNQNPQMVDVSDKDKTQRIARACGKIIVNRAAFLSVQEETNKKGPVLQTAIIAAIMGAKKQAS